MTAFAPTAEQAEAVRLFQTGESLKIEAGAGTGKTSTLLLLAAAAGNRRGQYIAFNKAIVDETKVKLADRDLKRCAANTAHSLAMREVGHRFRERLGGNRMKSMELAARLGTEEIRVEYEGQRKVLSRSFLAGLVMKSVARFCTTADEQIGARHVPFIHGIDNDVADGTSRSFANNNLVADALVPYLRKAWTDSTRVDGQLPYTHDRYLKLWQLSAPVIGADYIMFDEAQDANPVMTAIVAAQAHRAQIVWVGDSQQQIYEFTGAVNALQNIESTHRTFLTKSFRFGPAIAEQANAVLATIPGAELRLVGHDPIPSRVEEVAAPVAILCRTNATAVRTVLGELRNGRRPYLVGGGNEVVAFARAAERLMRGEHADHPELACFDSWGEVQHYVEKDPQGGDLKLLVQLIDDFGVPTIIEALDGMCREAAADLIVSTAHKAKGREWDTVALADDFGTDPDVGEKRLLYVALTRAKLVLDITAVEFLMTLPAAASLAAGETVAPAAPATQTSQSGPEPAGATVSPSPALEAPDVLPVAPTAPNAADALPVPQTGIVGICAKCGKVVAADADPYDSGRCINGTFAASHPPAAITWHRLYPAPTPDRFMEAL